jgi:hypothetical protein
MLPSVKEELRALGVVEAHVPVYNSNAGDACLSSRNKRTLWARLHLWYDQADSLERSVPVALIERCHPGITMEKIAHCQTELSVHAPFC